MKLLGKIITIPILNRFFLWYLNAKNHSLKHEPVFIVGAPRTGSTILYQVLTNNYDVGFIDNLASYFYRCLPLGIWLSNILFGNRPHNNFRSDHGNTHEFGFHAPSECGNFWYRWLPNTHHFIEHGELETDKINEIREEIRTCLRIVKSPFLFKNLNAGQRLRLICEMYPNAKIIYIRRDPIFTVRSILKARSKVGVGKGQWWSIKPKEYQTLLDLDETEMCVAQVLLLEKQIEEDLNLFDSKNVYNLHYDELSEEEIVNISMWLKIKQKKGAVIPTFLKDDLSNLHIEKVDEVNKKIEKWYARDRKI